MLSSNSFDRYPKFKTLDEHAAHTAGRWAAIWKLDSERLAYAGGVLIYTRDLTTDTAFDSSAAKEDGRMSGCGYEQT